MRAIGKPVRRDSGKRFGAQICQDNCQTPDKRLNKRLASAE